MHKIKDLIKDATNILKAAGIETAALEARILLELASDMGREELFLKDNMSISDDTKKKFDKYIQRRSKREPLAYITGVKEFFGLEFKINEDVLVPRPESEILVEEAIKLFKPDKDITILDIGTGSGCLILSILHKMKNSSGIAVDISKGALSVARKNAVNLGLKNRVMFFESSFSAGIEDQFDLIISNPPYVRDTDLASLEPEVSIYEPALALKGGRDGLGCYRRIAKQIYHKLKLSGFLVMEFGQGQEEEVRLMFEAQGFVFVSYYKDLAGIIRGIILTKN